MIQLGLCCINIELREKEVFCSRTMVRKNFTVEKAKSLSLKNISDISTLCEWNAKNNIHCLRLSSDIFPHFTDDETEPYSLDFAKEALQLAGETAKKCGQRIVMHPGQYNQVGAKDEKVFQKTCRELEMHAFILDTMGVDQDGVLCVHGGGVYKNKEQTIERWIEQFHRLPESVRRRLAIENCERCYSTVDCLKIAEACNIPLIFDTHHYECFNHIYQDEAFPIDDVMPRVIATWQRRQIKPLFHISEQRENSRVGTHSDYIEVIPDYILEIPEKYKVSLDIEVEAKMKEKAIMKLYKKYPQVFKRKLLFYL